MPRLRSRVELIKRIQDFKEIERTSSCLFDNNDVSASHMVADILRIEVLEAGKGK